MFILQRFIQNRFHQPADWINKHFIFIFAFLYLPLRWHRYRGGGGGAGVRVLDGGCLVYEMVEGSINVHHKIQSWFESTAGERTDKTPFVSFTDNLPVFTSSASHILPKIHNDWNLSGVFHIARVYPSVLTVCLCIVPFNHGHDHHGMKQYT